MTRLRFVLACAVILLAASGCAGGSPQGSTPPSPQADRNLITRAELSQREFSSVYAAIEALHPNWLALRGPVNTVEVYLDGQHLGGVETLFTIPVPSVESIRHMDGIEAAARYGVGHDQGAILVTTHHGGP
jgi:hypothetical protein